MKKEKIRESKKGKNEVKWEKWHRSPKMRRLQSVEWWRLAQGALTRWAVSARPRAEVPAAPAPPSPQGGPGSPLRSCPGSRGWTRARCGGRSPCWRRLKKQKEHPHEWAGETLCCKPRGLLCGLLGTTTKSKPLKNVRQLLKKDFYGRSKKKIVGVNKSLTLEEIFKISYHSKVFTVDRKRNMLGRNDYHVGEGKVESRIFNV